jgi:hypothetical protein
MVCGLEVYLKNTKETNMKELDSELLPFTDPERTLTIQVLQHVLQYSGFGWDEFVMQEKE